MKSKKIHFILTAASSLVLVTTAHAQIVDWKAGGDNVWSNTANWSTGVFPNANTVDARFNINNNVQINVDGSYTVRSYFTGFAANVSNAANEHLVFGDTLTIDTNNASAANGIYNASNNNIKLRLNCDVTVHNTVSATVDTYVVNQNGANNIVEFGNNCALTLTTKLRTNTNLGAIIFNCSFSPSTENLLIGSNNVSFGPNHTSTGFGKDIILLANSKLAVDGGTVLNTGRKFQVNGSGAELELNAADAINNANLIIAGSNAFLLDVKANQATMGVVNINNAPFTIDVDPTVTNLAFGKSSGQNWGSGSITINGFKENTIRFGTDNTGLTAGQLAVIDGGIYSLTPAGYLTAMPAGNNYASWASANGIPGEPFDGDFNNDGISNGVAYALGLSPTAFSQPAGILLGTTITYTKGAEAIANEDVSWIIETSETLTGVWLEEVTQAAGDPAASISYNLNPVPGTPKKFARLKAVKTP